MTYNAFMNASLIEFDIVIIGGGTSGVLVALHTLRQATRPVRIGLIEPSPVLAQGIAYATRHPEHLLNVPTRGMSAFADAPEDFLDYLMQRHDCGTRDAVAVDFAMRSHYGAYLQERLGQACSESVAALEVVRDQVTACEPDNDGVRLTLASGVQCRARGAVLAIGNQQRPLPARGAESLSADLLVDAWNYDAVKAIGVDAEVGIVGSGLSMVDAVLSLATNGHRGSIHVLSRHALLPQSHDPSNARAEYADERLPELSLRQRVRFLRTTVRQLTAQGIPWQAVMERIRPHGQTLWRSLSMRDQRRFLRHVVRYWDVHRHRIAQPVHARLQALIASGQLRMHHGRADRVSALPDGRIRLEAVRADGSRFQLELDVLVNAVGLEIQARQMHNPLLIDLLGKGKAVPGPHGIGIDTEEDGHVVAADGQPLTLYTLGSLRVGRLWESIAVPELRVQAHTVAKRMLARLEADCVQAETPR